MIEERYEHTAGTRLPGPGGPGSLDTTFLRGEREVVPEEGEERAGLRAGFSLRGAMASAGLVLAGFVLGLALFMPSEVLWSNALKAMSGEGLSVEWARLRPMGLFGAKLEQARVGLRGVTLHFSELELDPGLLSPLTLRARTGEPSLEARLAWTRRLTVDGGADTAKLMNSELVSGMMNLRADLRFTGAEAIPESGSVEMEGLDLVLPGGVIIEDAQLALVKDNHDLSLESFRVEKPFPIEARGSAELNPDRLPDSQYSLSGKIVMGGKPRDFNLSGKISELLKMASGKGAAGAF